MPYPPGSYPALVIADGASHYWRLDETSGTLAHDLIGGANGTISGGVTLNQPGAVTDPPGATAFIPAIAIGGELTGRTAARRVLIASLSIHDQLNEVPNTCTFTVQGARPTEGAEILIAYDTIDNPDRLFAGNILRVTDVTATAADPRTVLYQVEGIDYTWQLQARLVMGRYTNQSATAIATDLIAKWAPAGFTGQIEAGLPVLDEISFTNTPLMDAFAQLARRIGGYAQGDYFKRIALWITATGTPPTALTPTHPSLESLSVTRDLSQIVTRVYVEGGGVTTIGPVDPGETRIPVEDTAWYEAAGGFVVSGPQRLSYTGIVAAGGGAMASAVGGSTGNTAPSSGPTITTSAGAGLPLGTYKYAFTWVTASGECLPSPVTPFNGGTAGGPVAAPTPTPAVGSELDQGRYRYVYTFATASGETVAGPYGEATTSITGTIAQPSGLPTCTLTTGTLPPQTYGYAYTFVNANGETTRSSSRTVNVQSPSGVQVTNIGVGPAGTTARRIYRTPGGSSTYKLLTTLSNNTATALPSADNTPDASLGVTAPTSNTTGVANCRMALTGIATGPTGTTARKLYRTVVNGTGFKLLTTLANNSTTTYTDTTPDASLGIAPPATGTAVLSLALVGGILTGTAGLVTARKVYRTKVNGSALFLLATIANNSATAIAADSTADAALVTAAPTTDTSGLVSGSGGQVNAGATSIPVASTAPFAPQGWAEVGTQLIRYNSVSSSALTGIPPSGVGSLGVSIQYDAPITVAPQITGIPASGAGAIVLPILLGDPVNLLVIRDDLTAQAALAALIGGTGVVEGFEQDNRISYEEAVARALAKLDLKSTVQETLRYRCRDAVTRSGTLITVDLPAPFDVDGTFEIQDVTLGEFLGTNVLPVYDVVASSDRMTFEDFLRRRRGGSGIEL